MTPRSRAPARPDLARGTEETAAARRVPAEARALDRDESRPLRVKQGFDPDRARHPPRPHASACASSAQFQELGHQVVADRRRLHGPRGRSERALEDAAPAHRRGRSRPTRRPISTSSSGSSTSAQDRDPLERRVVRAACPSPTSSSSPSQFTVARVLERDDFAKRWQARAADQRARAALPADAGPRLGRDPRRRRARRHRAEVQPAGRARPPGAPTGRSRRSS